MAKTLEVKTMNGSVVTAKMAGMESTAKMRSVVSTAISASSSGVAARPPRSRTKKRWPWYSGHRTCAAPKRTSGFVLGMRLACRRLNSHLDAGEHQEGAEDVDDPVEARR